MRYILAVAGREPGEVITGLAQSGIQQELCGLFQQAHDQRQKSYDIRPIRHPVVECYR